MKLLIVFTGGTIGSRIADGSESPVITLDREKPYRLLEAYQERYELDFAYNTVSPLSILSENHTGTTIAAIAEAVKQGMQGDYDGIVVTHGTDTLQYTAAALGYAFGNDCIPVCLVSSNRPLGSKGANGIDNLHAAVEWIRGGFGRGVVVCYHDPGERGITVHRATRMIASQMYSEHFYSVRDLPVGWMSGSGRSDHGRSRMPLFAENALYKEKADGIPTLKAECMKEVCGSVVRIFPYPGMRYPEIPKGVTDIMHESFHSGTIRTDGEETEDFFAWMRERGIRVWLCGAAEGAVYESAKRYETYEIKALPVMSPIAAYMKLWMLNANGRDAEKEMYHSLGGDLVV